MENKVIKLIGFGPLIFIPLFVYMIIFFIAKENKHDFETMLSKVEIDLLNTKKKEIKLKVDGLSNLVEYQFHSNKTTPSNHSEIINFIQKVNFNNDLFVFIIHKNKLIYENFNEVFFNKKDLLKKILSYETRGENDAFLSFFWKDDSNADRKTFSYFHKMNVNGMILGLAFNEISIKNSASNNTIALYSNYSSKIENIVIFGVFSIIISLLISFFISTYLDRTFVKYNEKIKKKEKELLKLNDSLEEKVKARTKELEASKQELEKLAKVDALTNINNRLSIMEKIDDEIIRTKRYPSPFSLIMYDLDFFKKVNDTYGHDVGDYVLAHSVKVIKNMLRESDSFGRYGGEEFLILLPNTPLKEAILVAERIRKNIEVYKFEHIEQLTLSIGVVESDGEKSSKVLLKEVDELMYKSKSSGRNCVSA